MGALVLSTLSGCNESSNISTSTDKNTSIDINATSLFESTNGYDIRSSNLFHPSAYITQMCYTKTKDDNGTLYNPCYSCHINNKEPNYIISNETLQGVYAFPESALKNPFLNNFIDFSARVAQISDQEIINYVDKTNYFDANNSIVLAKKLQKIPQIWDANGDGKWGGYIPDCYYNFNTDGFDRDPNGKPTGWVAFAYMPFLGTFFPTNGSTDDVLIRLDRSFQIAQEGGDFNATIYKLNLSIVEAVVKQKNIAISPIDENSVGVDLNKNNKLDIASEIVFDWAPNEGRYMSYVGYAKQLLDEGKIHLAGGLYPENTEFLHSVRYIKSDNDSEIALAPRMKELRYAKKTMWLTYASLYNQGLAGYKESQLSPDKLATFRGDMESGLGNNMGWIYQGFIEDKFGDLRPQSYEETLNCMGCHSGLGATTDSTFSFARKLDNNFQNGWYHPTQKDLKGIAENRYSDGTWEFSHYLKLNPYADEFRENSEVKEKFTLPNGEQNQTMLDNLHNDVSLLLYPSHKRALDLDKAYKALVETQKFYDGRAGHIHPLTNVYKELTPSQSTGNAIYTLPK